jgi:hypothetical protein
VTNSTTESRPGEFDRTALLLLLCRLAVLILEALRVRRRAQPFLGLRLKLSLSMMCLLFATSAALAVDYRRRALQLAGERLAERNKIADEILNSCRCFWHRSKNSLSAGTNAQARRISRMTRARTGQEKPGL